MSRGANFLDGLLISTAAVVDRVLHALLRHFRADLGAELPDA
jgi:hypothetical protein